jgi:hypothetical protein
VPKRHRVKPDAIVAERRPAVEPSITLILALRHTGSSMAQARANGHGPIGQETPAAVA